MNHPSTTEDDAVTAVPGVPATILPLANDFGVDQDRLSITTVTRPAHGTAVTNAEASIACTPAESFHGDDVFTYAVSDGDGGSDTAAVTITVAEASTTSGTCNRSVEGARGIDAEYVMVGVVLAGLAGLQLRVPAAGETARTGPRTNK